VQFVFRQHAALRVCLSCLNIGMTGKPTAQYAAHIRKLRQLKHFLGGFSAKAVNFRLGG